MRTGQTGAGGWQGGTGKMERGGGTTAEKRDRNGVLGEER